jgi:hypothetical protein
MKRRLFAVILSVVLALTLTSSFIVVAMELGKYRPTDIYIGALWSFAILLIFSLSISSKLEWLFQRKTY